MQTVSQIWEDLRATPGTEVEYKFDIDGTEYGPEAEVSHSVHQRLYETFGIGNACCGSLTLELFAESIPRGACIKRYARLVNGELASEWIPKGVFYINTRQKEDDLWEIEAFDAMRRADVVWEPDQALSFPMAMQDAVELFCGMMDIDLDPRTVLEDYTIDYPTDEQTIRQILQYIAAANGGNWIITDAGKLLLVPLLSIPEQTNLLITESGYVITFGGDAILV